MVGANKRIGLAVACKGDAFVGLACVDVDVAAGSRLVETQAGLGSARAGLGVRRFVRHAQAQLAIGLVVDARNDVARFFVFHQQVSVRSAACEAVEDALLFIDPDFVCLALAALQRVAVKFQVAVPVAVVDGVSAYFRRAHHIGVMARAACQFIDAAAAFQPVCAFSPYEDVVGSAAHKVVVSRMLARWRLARLAPRARLARPCSC